MVLSPDGAAAHRGSLSGAVVDAEQIGRELGAQLLSAAGGRDFLA